MLRRADAVIDDRRALCCLSAARLIGGAALDELYLCWEIHRSAPVYNAGAPTPPD
jgi:hypothetical protein